MYIFFCKQSKFARCLICCSESLPASRNRWLLLGGSNLCHKLGSGALREQVDGQKAIAARCLGAFLDSLQSTVRAVASGAKL